MECEGCGSETGVEIVVLGDEERYACDVCLYTMDKVGQ